MSPRCFVLAAVVVVLLPTSAGAQRVIVRDVDLIDAKSAEAAAVGVRQPDSQGVGGGRVSGGTRSGNVQQARMEAFLRLEASAVRIGTPVVAVVEIVNRSTGPLEIPSEGSVSASFAETPGDAVLSVSAELLCDGRRHSLLPGPTLHGAQDDPGSRTTLQPGEGLRVRFELRWLGSAQARKPAPTATCVIRPLVGFLRSFPGSSVVVFPGEAGQSITVERSDR